MNFLKKLLGIPAIPYSAAVLMSSSSLAVWIVALSMMMYFCPIIELAKAKSMY